MSIHRQHPNSGDPVDAVLYDDCPRCAEHAKHPTFSLDRDNLRTMTAKTLNVEVGPGPDHYATIAEADAGHRIWESLMLVQKLTGMEMDEIRNLLL